MELLSGDALVMVAALLSIQIAQGRTVDQLGLLSAFFQALGENLDVIAAQRTIQSP